MPFIPSILPYRSLSIVGLEKNTGKTVCLNYVLSRLNQLQIPVTVTSIGVDGEQTDSVYATAKPEITLYEGMQFVTSQQHYDRRRLVSRILAVDERRTALGQLVTAEVLCRGKVLLSGAATTSLLRQQIADSIQRGVNLTVVDGALSRLSLASPAVTEAMILATGAAVSPSLPQLISKTRFLYRLIQLPEVEATRQHLLADIDNGLWEVTDEGECFDLGIPSVFALGHDTQLAFRHSNTLYVAGAVSDRLLQYLSSHRNIRNITLVVKDFSKLFVTPAVVAEFTRRGGQLRVVQRSRLVAVCFNPTSPQGYRLDSATACQALADALQTPVYDVMNIK